MYQVQARTQDDTSNGRRPRRPVRQQRLDAPQPEQRDRGRQEIVSSLAAENEMRWRERERPGCEHAVPRTTEQPSRDDGDEQHVENRQGGDRQSRGPFRHGRHAKHRGHQVKELGLPPRHALLLGHQRIHDQHEERHEVAAQIAAGARDRVRLHGKLCFVGGDVNRRFAEARQIKHAGGSNNQGEGGRRQQWGRARQRRLRRSSSR